MAEQLNNQREVFDIPDDLTYLNCAAQSPLLRTAVDAGLHGVRRKARPWVAEERVAVRSEVERSRELFGSLIGANAGDIAVIHASSYGLAIAAENLELAPGEQVLVIEDQFPSNFHVWRLKALAAGAEMNIVPTPSDLDWTSAVVERINPKVAIVALPACRWNDGSTIDLVAVGERCRAMGAELVIDATQTAGALELDVKAIQPAFLVASGYKWLLCPYTLAFLYAAPRFHAGRPIEHYTWTQTDLPALGAMRGDDMDGPLGARRFDMGERNNPVNLGMAAIALEQLVAWGTGQIASTIEPLVDRAAALAEDRQMRVPPKAARSKHFIGIRRDGGWPDDLEARLAQESVFISKRGDALRVSPYLYNEPQDIDRLFEVIDRV